MANTGRYVLVPPIVVGLVLPGVLLLIRAGNTAQLSALYVEKCTTLLIPAVAAWWPPFVFKERIEGDGRELLYFLKREGEGMTALALGLCYLALTTPFVLAASGTAGFAVTTVVLLAARCMFVTLLAFCAAFLLKSSAMGLVLALLFNMVAMVPLERLAESGTVELGGAVTGGPAAAAAAYALLSVALLYAGEIRGRRFTP
jgi:hypothetical protein